MPHTLVLEEFGHSFQLWGFGVYSRGGCTLVTFAVCSPQKGENWKRRCRADLGDQKRFETKS